MKRKRISEEHTLPDNCFRDGEFLLTLTENGVLCSKRDGEEERLLSYDEVRVYRSVQRKSATDLGKSKLFLTAPFPFSQNYGRYCFQEDGKRYLTHEFTEEERKRAEDCLARFKVKVVERKTRPSPIPKLYKRFSEAGSLSRRLFVAGLSVFAALLLGVVIMYLLNHFLHTETEGLAMVFGIFCVPCLAVVLIKSQELGSVVKIYDCGVRFLVRMKSGDGTVSPFAIYRAFFTWDEVEEIERVQSQVEYLVRFRIGYCVYSVPDVNGLYEYLENYFPQKCKSEE